MSQPTNPPPPPMNPYDAPEHRGSGAGRVLLGLGLGCGVMLLLCCGVMGLGIYSVTRMVETSAVKDPQAVENLCDQIVTITVPDSLEPEGGMNVDLPFVGPFLKGVFYTNASKDARLVIGEFNQTFGSRADLESRLRVSVGSNTNDDFEVRESEPFDSKVNGQPAHFLISSGVGRKSHTEQWAVTGEFQGKGGTGVLLFSAPAAEFTQDEILDMLQSMQ